VGDGEHLDDPLARLLAAAEDAPPGEAVEASCRHLRRTAGVTDVSFLMVDLAGRGLIRLAHPGPDATDEPVVLSAEGTAVEQALRTQALQVLPPGAARPAGLSPGWLVVAPVTERGDALGLLAVWSRDEPDESLLGEVRSTAHVLAYVVIATRRHTDRFEWTQRSESFSLPAEIQRRLLPAALTCEAGAFTLSAWLEPAADVGGDTIDYSVERRVLHLSMTDAMGHGVGSALTATLCVGSLRNTRRRGATLLQQVGAANAALARQGAATGDEGFATGLFGRLDLRTGVLSLVNAGHVPPYLARDGSVTPLDLPVDLPLGMFADTTYRTTDVPLVPGDRLVLVTDGMLERKAASLDLVAELLASQDLHPREASRHLADGVLAVTGPDLDDDATLLVVDWHGPPAGSPDGGGERDSVAGADQDRASPPA
jgi:serine phosphatase RsbU (regulator of sigma subunit)